ncbi:MAG: glycerol-3-phosphate acyltransferase [Clostridiales bacterium]|nr:glycerol-3-phosphate acyltransferase [Clostridiales bacterium]
MNIRVLIFIAGGYFLGGILFARVFSRIFYNKDVTADSKDANPGTVNAFTNGGFACGMLTLLGDMAKGFIPVFFFLRYGQSDSHLALALVMLAPVAGHILTPYYHFKGGKGNATTFGILLGLAPYIVPLAILIVGFLFYTLVVRISPDFMKLIITYITAAVLMIILVRDPGVLAGFLLITAFILVRMFTSKEEREKTRVRILWMQRDKKAGE